MASPIVSGEYRPYDDPITTAGEIGAAPGCAQRELSEDQLEFAAGREPISVNGNLSPSRLRLDNGPDFVALALAEWAGRNGIKLDFIEPGRPMQSGFIERFNGGFRRGILDMHVSGI